MTCLVKEFALSHSVHASKNLKKLMNDRTFNNCSFLCPAAQSPPCSLLLGAENKMAADVPLLTQDDFLSHLKLQPVTSKAAFAYRHALKERRVC